MTPSLKIRFQRMIGALRGQSIIPITQDARELRNEIERILQHSVEELRQATDDLRGGCESVFSAVAQIRGPAAQLIQFSSYQETTQELNRLTKFLKERDELGKGEMPVDAAVRLIRRGDS